MRRTLSIVVVLVVLLVCAAAHAKLVAAPGEQVTSFDADIVVNADSTLTVREDFVVHSEGSYFKYGFTRQLPIDDEARWDERYKGPWKKDNGIRVAILELTENGAPVDYRQGSGFGYPQLQIGPRNIPLAPGDHHYVIRYTVEGALALSAHRDMLYWNAIGHYWSLPVADARVTVHFPSGVAVTNLSIEPHVGGRGVSDNQEAPETVATQSDAGTSYAATGLRPRQSLSFVATWPAGFVTEPSLGIWNRDKRYLAAPAALCLYYLVVWVWIGREPKPGTAVVRYEPPTGVSPAAARYLLTTGTDGRTLAAVIAALAARDCLRVGPHDGLYRLIRLASNPSVAAQLAPEEVAVLRSLFEDGPTVDLSPSMAQENSSRNSRYVANIHAELSKRLDGVYFTRHFGVIALGVLATFAMAFPLAATAQGRDSTAALFMTAWLLFCGLILGVMIETGLIPAIKAALRGMAGWGKLLPGTAAVGIFGFFFALLLKRMAQGVSPAFSLMVVALILVNLTWAPFLKRMTPVGRSTLDALEGFRQFLVSVEQDRLERLNDHEAAPAEVQYLPYAIALEVREAWGDHLAEAFFATTIQR